MSSKNTENQSNDFPLDDLAFDVVTILYEKSKGMEAYQKYLKDAQGNQDVARVIQQIMDQDRQSISQLKQLLPGLLGRQQGASGGDVELSAASTGGGQKTGPTS